MASSTRRTFLKTAAASAAACTVTGGLAMAAKREYDISLAAWSLHRTIGEGEGKIPMLDMPKLAREEFDIGAIELVNRMLVPHTKSFDDMKPYLEELAANAKDHDVKILLTMVDREGDIGSTNNRLRSNAVFRHKKWMDITKFLGGHSIRMNWKGAPDDVVQQGAEPLTEFIDRSVPGFRELCEYGENQNINVILENHWGASSYPSAVTQLIEAIDHPRFGTLPDFGNFPEDVDKYEAVDSMMKYAKAVSAKCYDFDDETGLETKLDYERLIANVVDKHGYHGYIGIEYEGNRLSEFDGIKACKKLLEKLKG
jgi:sugar phosphate isomerase/epimerase